MKNFTFYNPVKVHFGKGKIAKVGQELSERGIRKVLLVAGSGSIKKNGVYEQVIESLKKYGIDWAEYWGVQPNPTLEHTKEGIKALRNNCCQALLPVGGGSVIDEAKGIAAGVYFDDLWDMYEFGSTVTKALPVFAVSTLSAAGSEMNANSVITNEESNLKLAIHSEAIFPKFTVIDPTAQATLPWEQTANGGMDTLSHIMEQYFTGTNEETTLSINEGLMKSVLITVNKLKDNSDNYDARADLAWASVMALNGVPKSGISGDWSVHAIEHAISGLHPEIAHARGLSAITSGWIKYMNQHKPEIFERWAKNVFGVDSSGEAMHLFSSQLRKWGMPTSMEKLGIDNSEFEKIADLTLFEGKPGVIKELDKDDILNILSMTNLF